MNRDSEAPDRTNPATLSVSDAGTIDSDWREKVTGPQLACLRLVGSGMTSKEIAIQTGLSPRTVDQYVNRVASVLGAATRRDAARLLANLENGQLKKLQLQSTALAEPLSSGDPDAVDRGGVLNRKARPLLSWIPPLGGERHASGFSATTVEIIKAAIVAAVAFGAIVATGAWLHSLFG